MLFLSHDLLISTSRLFVIFIILVFVLFCFFVDIGLPCCFLLILLYFCILDILYKTRVEPNAIKFYPQKREKKRLHNDEGDNQTYAQEFSMGSSRQNSKMVTMITSPWCTGPACSSPLEYRLDCKYYRESLLGLISIM